MIEIKHKETGKVLHTVDADTLQGVDLSGANLNGANLSGSILTNANLSGASLRGSYLGGASLIFTNMSNAHLELADLSSTTITRSNLNCAHLQDAILGSTDLFQTDLRGADLTGAILVFANIHHTYWQQTNLSRAALQETVIVDCPTFHQAEGLETVQHRGHSTLDARTLRTCVTHLPDVFLQGVGYNQQEIDYLRSMYANGTMQGGIKYYSCFLSYAHSDNAFVERLRTDLIRNGVNCWKDDDLQTGTKWKEEIDRAIRGHEKLVLVCSWRSLYHDQVVREILRALDEECSEGTQKFFPVCLDKSISDEEVMDDAREKVRSGEWRENWVYHIRKYKAADFSQWENEAAYQKALGKLLHDLKHPQKRETTGEGNAKTNTHNAEKPLDNLQGALSSSLSAVGQAAVGQMTGGSVSGIHIEQVHFHAPIHHTPVPQCKWSDLGSNVIEPKPYEVPKLNGVIIITPQEIARVAQLGGNPTLLLQEQAGTLKDTMTTYQVIDISL